MTTTPAEIGSQLEQFSPEEMAVIDEMINAGVLHGRKHSKTNPKMGKYILSTRRGIDVIDLQQTWQLLNKAIDFLKEVAEKKLPILVVGTKPASRDLVSVFASELGLPFVTERWLGGTLTNFKTIAKRTEYLKKIRSEKEAGLLEKYTKKERLIIDRKIEKMLRLFSGIESLDRLPGVLIIIDTVEHETAVREANRLNIPVVGLVNTDANPDQVNFPIPCNDNARTSVTWVLNKIKQGMKKDVVG